VVGLLAADGGNWVTQHAWLIPALPLAAFLLIWALGKRTPTKGGSLIGIGAIGIAAVLSYINLAAYIGGGPLVEKSTTWFGYGNGLKLPLGMRIDGLTAVMFVVVCTVSLMVQIYSTGYMHGDKRYTWFFMCLNLFTFSMLVVVISNNLLQLLVGWELVGVCSYLLIGFWWEEKANSNAAIKAFVTTRTGDVAMVTGILLLWHATKTFDIGRIIEMAHHGEISTVTLTAGALLLFGGAIGKSAQFPLYVWLPDAMAGPTPVSALIHAATMVTAGVFLVARMFPIFESSHLALNFVAIIGCITMLMAALLAMVQDDIKRVLAYSTVSQLAYMVAALGVGAGNASIFHLFTHAWFKALLFLGSGSVIHACHSNNMSDMGGLKKYMPTTYWTFLIGTIAIAGIPPFAGFWSKDEILTEAYRYGAGSGEIAGTHVIGYVVYGVGLLTAFLTAFYMTRAFMLTFEGDYRGTGHPHESPKSMTVPLMVLAGLSMVAGLVGIPGWHKGFSSWTRVGLPEGGTVHFGGASLPLIFISVAAAAGGIMFGRRMYVGRLAKDTPDPIERLGWFHKLLVNKYYLDDLYMKGIVYPIRDGISNAMYWVNQHVLDGAVNGAAAAARAAGEKLYENVDQKIIDGAVNGAGIGTRRGAGLLRYIQSGDVQRYAAILFVGVAVLAFLFTRFS
jgi:NADH-quinone oxidoreductase subunit L